MSIKWQEDSETDKCNGCDTKLGLIHFHRKHHCRYCGFIFCSECTNTIYWLSWNNNPAVRTCKNCKTKHDPQNTGKSASAKPYEAGIESGASQVPGRDTPSPTNAVPPEAQPAPSAKPQPQAKITSRYLRVKVLRATKLKNKDVGGLSDPYVVLSMGKQMFQTKVLNNTLDPEWNQEFFFDLLKITQPILAVDVYDKDLLTSNRIGNGNVDITKAKVGSTRGEVLELGRESQLFLEIEALDHMPTKIVTSAQKAAFVRIVVLNAVKIKNTDGSMLTGLSDPYITLSLGKQKFQTSVKYDTLDPYWNESFVFDITKQANTSLQLQIFDKDLLSSQRLGSHSVELKHAKVGEAVSEVIPLASGGHLFLELHGLAEPPPQSIANLQPKIKPSKVRVGIMNATHLKNMDGPLDKSDPFVVLSLSKQKFQTSVKNNTLDPVWNESFVFDLTTQAQTLVQIQLFDKDFMGEDKMGEEWIDLRAARPGTPVRLALSVLTGGTIFIELEDVSAAPPPKSLTDRPVAARVGVIRAIDLANLDGWGAGKSDPFVILTLGDQQFQTKVISDNLNPVWEEFFIFDLTRQEQTLLRFEVRDQDMMSSKTMGSGWVDLKKARVNVRRGEALPVPSGGTLFLEIQGLTANTVPSPEVSGAAVATATAAKPKDDVPVSLMRITVLNAVNLSPLGNPFVLLNMGRKKYQTKVAQNDANPIWNEDFRAEITHADISILDVDVMYREEKGETKYASGSVDLKPVKIGSVHRHVLVLPTGHLFLELEGLPGGKPPIRADIVNVGVVNALHLPGPSDSFVVLSIGKQRFQSKVQHDTANPNWNENFSVSLSMQPQTLLHVELFTRKETEDLRIAHEFIELKTVTPKTTKGEVIQWTIDKIVGSLFIELSGLENKPYQAHFSQSKEEATAVKVVVVQGLKLKNMDSLMTGSSDPFVVLNLGKQQVQTEVLNDTVNPIWNESFVFDLTKQEQTALRVRLFDKDIVGQEKMGEDWVNLKQARIGVRQRILLPMETGGHVVLELEGGRAPPPRPKGIQVKVSHANYLPEGQNLVSLTLQQQKFQTKISNTTTSPVWNETFVFDMTLQEQTVLKIALYKKSPSKENKIGPDEWFDLKKIKINEKKKEVIMIEGGGLLTLELEGLKDPPPKQWPLVRVRVINAISLPKRDTVGKVDPFVTLTLNEQRARTSAISNNQDPIWNEEFIFDTSKQPQTLLRVQLYDKDLVGSDKILDTWIDLKKAVRNPRVPEILAIGKEGESALFLETGVVPDDYKPVPPKLLRSGEFKFVRVGVVNAVNLTNLEAYFYGVSDPYVMLTLGKQVFKTEVKDGTLNPVWYSDYIFDLTQQPQTLLKVDVYDSDYLGYKTMGSGWLDLRRARVGASARHSIVLKTGGTVVLELEGFSSAPK